MSYDITKSLNNWNVINWKVTRSLVSYDKILFSLRICFNIERSPDHWWVTTTIWFLAQYQSEQLKGHQIIGELRLRQTSKHPYGLIERSPDHWWVTTVILKRLSIGIHWKVTRSLVSYDIDRIFKDNWCILKGHQIIGELRLRALLTWLSPLILKGHQIIGELRLLC